MLALQAQMIFGSSMAFPWVLWMLAIIGSFALLEGYAFKHPDREWTLSRTIAFAGARFPLSIAMWGMLIGGLSVHFFWPFCPSFAPSVPDKAIYSPVILDPAAFGADYDKGRAAGARYGHGG